MNKGIQSTEFWLTLLTQLLLGVLTALGKIPAESGAALMGGGSAVYVSGRSAAKMVAARAAGGAGGAR